MKLGSLEDFPTRPFLLFLVGPRRDVRAGPSSHMSCVLVNSLGSMLLALVVRVFFGRSSRRLVLYLRSRGLVGIGSGVGWVSGIAG